MGTQKALDDSGKGEFDPELGANAAPAGGIAASANDMGRWIAIQLARGALPGGSGRLFSEASSRQMWMPRVPLPISASPGPTAAATPQFSAYALGWSERDYRGHRLLTHTGAVFGAQAIIMLIPEREVGFSVAINCEDGEAALGIAYELLDHYLDRPAYDWGAAWQQVVRERDERAVAALKQQSSAPAKVGPSLALERYAGEFADAWYGPIAIAHRDGRLTIDFKQTPGMTGELTHWQYDTFRADVARPADRAGLRDVRAERRRRHRPHRPARGLAPGGLQLRLPGPRLQAGRAEVRLRIRQSPIVSTGTTSRAMKA